MTDRTASFGPSDAVPGAPAGLDTRAGAHLSDLLASLERDGEYVVVPAAWVPALRLWVVVPEGRG